MAESAMTQAELSHDALTPSTEVKQMTNAKMLELAERLEATIHQINGHWWNRRFRPDARDIRAAVDVLRATKDREAGR